MFNPSDFLDLAKELGSNNEARIRTAVGRAYYGSFLTVRDALSIDEKTPSVHRKVLSELYSKNPVAANRLHYLRRLRNIADYDTKIAMKAEDAEKSVKFAEELITEVYL